MNIIYYKNFFKEINRIYGINKADVKFIIENLYLEFERYIQSLAFKGGIKSFEISVTSVSGNPFVYTTIFDNMDNSYRHCELFSNIFDKERAICHFTEFENYYNNFLKILKRIWKVGMTMTMTIKEIITAIVIFIICYFVLLFIIDITGWKK